ncbi:MAG: DNA phosphorothioation system sulfurtransferase DndC [Burkholderiaceae bacterium]|nr:MAG: DNA phosphorothioation system sulfurtransferase DndC [Burkholderiaceae bacterium]
MKKNSYIYGSHFELLDDLAIADRPLKDLIKEIQDTYLADSRPWIIGFSGGKDSTSILSLIYAALLKLRPEKRLKHIYVVSSDTLVETPVVVDMIDHLIGRINSQSKEDGLPMSAHKVVPKMNQTFWVNLLGRGYPAPTQSFRWCTERMKIDPVSEFIKSKAAEFGQVVVVLGSRSQESASRAQVIKKHKGGGVLSKHSSLPNAYTYMPIVEWSADEVWQYLMSAKCPWDGDNQMLFELYKGSNQGECPLVIDKSTPSCGNSRFGCWTCTVVSEDKALHGLIQSGEVWMKPLLEFRNMLYRTTKPEAKTTFRNHKRRTGKVSYMRGEINDDTNAQAKHVPGPYWIKYRKEWLKELLEIQKSMNDAGHEIDLIHEDELHAIRQEWLRDPNEPDWADSLPRIYHDVYGVHLEWIENDAGAFTEPDANLLQELGGKHGISAELVMKLIEVELSVSGLGSRKGIRNKIENILKRDWESLEYINTRNFESKIQTVWKDKLKDLQNQYKRVPSL